MFEHLYAESVDSDTGSSLVQDVADRVAAATAPKLGAELKQPLISLSVPLPLDTAGCCMTSIIDLRSLALSLMSSFESKPVMTSTNFACGMGGFTIGGMLAGFVPIQNKDIAATTSTKWFLKATRSTQLGSYQLGTQSPIDSLVDPLIFSLFFWFFLLWVLCLVGLNIIDTPLARALSSPPLPSD